MTHAATKPIPCTRCGAPLFEGAAKRVCSSCGHSLSPLPVARGSTLLFIVLGVLVGLAVCCIAGVGLTGMFVYWRADELQDEAQVDSARIQIEVFDSALQAYYLDQGEYPSDIEGLLVLYEPPKEAQRWRGPYVDGQSSPLDPWGVAYVYERTGPTSYRITSAGPDRRWKTADDIPGGEN